KAPANWEAIANAVKVRDKMKSKTLIVGNGDIQNYQDGIIKAKASGVDGVMIGRASFGNPWIFKLGGENPKKGFPLPTLANRLAASPFQSFGSREVNSPAVNLSYQPSIKERLKALLEHAKLFEKWYRHKKSFATLRKHFKAYASGFEGSKELRIKLMQTKNAAETAKVVKEFLKRAKAV
ncbi:MAG: tRNA-dihydrouridine synthase, partial [Candidatus Doudnabacteria bacterium]|nr:tRNA-dihydrouridine synthase [Candidatus Doudnabacteria bacterium]